MSYVEFVSVPSQPPCTLVTPEILWLLLATWSAWPKGSWHDALMLWAAFCLGFFGFLWSGEFTCPTQQGFRPHMLGVWDVHVDSRDNPIMVSVRLCRSKSGHFEAGVTIHLGWTRYRICPVSATLDYLVRREMSPAHYFYSRMGPCCHDIGWSSMSTAPCQNTDWMTRECQDTASA